MMVTLAIATSIDALAVGLSIAALGMSIWYPSVVIGAITALMCMLAILGGKRIGRWLGNRAQILGGSILFFIALRIVITHTA
jgi:putative Mn2+ efflux pump MntP